MFQRFEEFTNMRYVIEAHLKEEEGKKKADSEEVELTDKDGPCKGKPFNKVGSEGHLLAMQYHSSKFNAIKNGKEHSDSDHVKKVGTDYHSKMYNMHKKAVS